MLCLRRWRSFINRRCRRGTLEGCARGVKHNDFLSRTASWLLADDDLAQFRINIFFSHTLFQGVVEFTGPGTLSEHIHHNLVRFQEPRV